MMIGLTGTDTKEQLEFDAFMYFLATQLGKTVEQLDGLSHREYIGWSSYFKAKHAIENPKKIGGGPGGSS